MRQRLLLEALDFGIKNKMPLLIKGAPGTGKTDLVKQAAKKNNCDVIISHPVVSNPTDYKGLPFPDKNGEKANFLPFGDLLRLIEADRPTVYFLDDLGQAPASVQASCMQLLLARRINGHVISDEVTFIAATNRRKDKAAVQGILEPVKSRFASILEIEVDVGDWTIWAANNGMPAILIAFINYRPGLLFVDKPTSDIINTPSPRTVAYLGTLINNGIMESASKVHKDLRDSYILNIIAGAVGEGFATEYLSFLEIHNSLPRISDIIRNPLGMPVPENTSQRFAICCALADQTNKRNIGNIVKYILRCPTEFQILYFKYATAKSPSIVNTKECTEWMASNVDQII
jgi:hypothetical protein